MPRVAEPAPLFAEVEPAKNPVRLCLQDDGRKVLGWISGTADHEGHSVSVTWGKESVGEVRIGKGNTFTWEYALDKPTPVSFQADLGEKQTLKDTITVAPAVGEKEPSVFFVG